MVSSLLNSIEEIEIISLASLKVLNLQDNKLIDIKSICKLPKLQALRLKRNPLGQLSPGIHLVFIVLISETLGYSHLLNSWI